MVCIEEKVSLITSLLIRVQACSKSLGTCNPHLWVTPKQENIISELSNFLE